MHALHTFTDICVCKIDVSEDFIPAGLLEGGPFLGTGVPQLFLVKDKRVMGSYGTVGQLVAPTSLTAFSDFMLTVGDLSTAAKKSIKKAVEGDIDAAH